MPVVKEPDVHGPGSQGRRGGRRSRRAVVLVVACAVAAVAGLTAWLWEDLTASPAVYVVGDSITYLSEPSITSDFSNAGYQPTIRATPGVTIGESEAEITALAQSRPWAWIIELGTNDAAAQDTVWSEPFLAEWSLVSAAPCVIYVTVSPRVGHVAQMIDASMRKLAQAHPNVHLLDWGTIEYQNPAWLAGDGIHPTSAGQAALAALETQELQHAC